MIFEKFYIRKLIKFIHYIFKSIILIIVVKKNEKPLSIEIITGTP